MHTFLRYHFDMISVRLKLVSSLNKKTSNPATIVTGNNLRESIPEYYPKRGV